MQNFYTIHKVLEREYSRYKIEEKPAKSMQAAVMILYTLFKQQKP